jgi:hypothetical protein
VSAAPGGFREHVLLAGWEIECCVPPPVVGAVVEWGLEFVPALDPPDPLLDRELVWSVQAGPDDVAQLVRGPVVAAWSDAPPPPGPVRLTGQLVASAHGGSSVEDLPSCRGRVERIRVLRQEYREAGDRTWEPVLGTVEAEDVAEAPRRYGDGDALGRQTFGVLLDLRVDPRLPRPADG